MSVSLTSLPTYGFLNPTPNHVFLLLPYIDRPVPTRVLNTWKSGNCFRMCCKLIGNVGFKNIWRVSSKKILFPQAFSQVTKLSLILFQTRVANRCFAHFSSAPRRFTHWTALESILTKFCALVLWPQSSGEFINGPNWFKLFRMAAILNSLKTICLEWIISM